MINLIHYTGDCFEFHKDVLSRKYQSKNDPDYKNRVEALNDRIQTSFSLYERHIGTNTLEAIPDNSFEGQDADDLRRLYSYKSTACQELKVKLTTTPTNTINNTCQYCTVGEVNSFDHILPKGDYSEYSVNPKNLFPCCTKCNSYKSEAVVLNGARRFLNLYLDTLPQVQYLFVDISLQNNTLDVEFVIDNRNGIDANLYAVIENHYSDLRLCERFKENSHSVVSDLKTEIAAYSEVLNIDQIQDSVTAQAVRNRSVWGFNFWKSILRLELINNDDFLQLL